jgi:hypothetical protein
MLALSSELFAKNAACYCAWAIECPDVATRMHFITLICCNMDNFEPK